MGSLATHLISVLLVVAIITATYGLIASIVARRNSRRSRGHFLLGFFCGFMSCAILRGRRRGLKALGTVARGAQVGRLGVGLLSGPRRFAARVLTVVAPDRPRWLSPQSHRQTSQRLWVQLLPRNAPVLTPRRPNSRRSCTGL